jgi:hypothetical protein
LSFLYQFSVTLNFSFIFLVSFPLCPSTSWLMCCSYQHLPVSIYINFVPEYFSNLSYLVFILFPSFFHYFPCFFVPNASCSPFSVCLLSNLICPLSSWVSFSLIS